MPKNNTIRFWKWRTFKKMHTVRSDSADDSSLSMLLHDTVKRFLRYVVSGIRGFLGLLRGVVGLVWLTLLITATVLILLKINQESINNISLEGYLASPLVHVLIAAFGVLAAYKVTKIASFMWLWLGPKCRWLKVFSVIITVALCICAYSLVVPQDDLFYLGAQILAIAAIAVGLIGSIRELLFNHTQRSLARAAKTLKERCTTEHFEINGQRRSVARLSRLLLREKDPSQPLTVAIDGAWGDGKSYIVDKVLEDIEKKSKNYIVMRFEPWRHVSEEAIVTSFYSSLSEVLSQLPGATSIGFDVAALSRSFVSKIDKTGIFEALASQLSSRASSKDSLLKANRLLTDSGKRLLVVIDDIERCADKKRVLRTLQLGSHLGSDIKNSTTIMIGDNRQLKKFSGVDETYLQKIFDEKVTVLPPTSAEMSKIIRSFMNELKLELSLAQDTSLDMLMRNIRGIKRVVVGVEQDLEGIGNNLNPQDIFGINVIKHAYPSIYADIIRNSRLYVAYSFGNFNDEMFSLYGLNFNEEASGFSKDQAKHFEQLLEDLDIKGLERRRVVSVLESLFPATKNRFDGDGSVSHDPNVKKYIRERRIGADIEHLERYFLLSNTVDPRHTIEDAQKQVSENYFAESDDEKRLEILGKLTKNNTEKSDEDLFYGGLSDMVAELEDRDSGDEDKRNILVRDMLRLYFRQTDYVVRNENRALVIILRTIDLFINSQNHNYIFEGIEEDMSHPSTGLRLLLYMNPARDNDFYNLKSYLGYNQLRKNILKKVDAYYVDENHDIIDEDKSGEDEWRFMVFQWATSVSYRNANDFVKARFNKVNTYLMKITENDPAKFRTLLRGAFWNTRTDQQEQDYIFDSTPQPYDADKFAARSRNILKQEDIDPDIRSMLERFLKEFKEYKSNN